ncbi:MAG: hypothetical protein ABL958_03540 [Bdellovibrionia bacterium]
MKWKMYLLWTICSVTASVVAYKKLVPPHKGTENKLAVYLPANSTIHKADVVEIPHVAGPIEFFHFSFSVARECGPGCMASHACFLVQNHAVTPFFASWNDPGEKPGFASTADCEPIDGSSCQNFLKTTSFFRTMFRSFYLEMTVNQQPAFKDCLTPDLKVRHKLIN